jgi:hypothetical protein
MDEIYRTINIIITAQKKARRDNNFLALMSNAGALLEYLPDLICYSVDQESEYRKYEAKLSDGRDDTGKRYTNSYCETQAKATDYYKEWQKSKLMIDLLYELTNMAKKLSGSINNEFNSH